MSKRRARQAPPKVRAALAYVHPGEVGAGFAYCAMRALMYELGTTGAPPAVIAQRCASGQLVESRNEVVEFFLNTDVEWLWCVDSDMGFGEDCLTRLLAVADPVTRPVVGALCFGLKKQGDDFDLQAPDLRCFPTVYQFHERDDDAGFGVVTDYPRDQLVECSATGAACFVVHRTVLEKIKANYGSTWFDRITHPKREKPFGEDLSFFVRVAGCDFPVFVDTSVKTSHDKGGIFLTEQRWDEQELVRRAH